MTESKKDYSVLTVEDDPIIARVIISILKDSGFLVDEPVDSGEKAISRVATKPPGVVLMDIDLMGWLSGIDTARLLLQFFSVPVIFITGHDEEEMLVRAEIACPFGDLIKPLSQSSLNTTIRVARTLHTKLCQTTEGKVGGLTAAQRSDLVLPDRPVILLDDRKRIVWMNDAAEFLLERSSGDLALADGSSSIPMELSDLGKPVVIFSSGMAPDTPLVFPGTSHGREAIVRLFTITDPYGDPGGFFLRFDYAGE